MTFLVSRSIVARDLGGYKPEARNTRFSACQIHAPDVETDVGKRTKQTIITACWKQRLLLK